MTIIFPTKDPQNWDSLYIKHIVISEVMILKHIEKRYYYIKVNEEMGYFNEIDLVGPPVIVTE